jgi:hypothetical protein
MGPSRPWSDRYLFSVFNACRFLERRLAELKLASKSPCEACRQDRITLLQKTHCRNSGRCVGAPCS